MQETDCRVFRFFNVFGKKWTYPLIYSFKPHENYSFGSIVKLTRMKINRTLLSKTLKELVSLELLEKSKKGYRLSKKGEETKKIFLDIKHLLFMDHKDPFCPDDCIIRMFKF